MLLALGATCSASEQWDVFSEQFWVEIEKGFEDGWKELFDESAYQPETEAFSNGNLSDVNYLLWTK